MADDYISSLAKEFRKRELCDICEELELEISISQHSLVIIEKIIADLDNNGIPEFDDCSELMQEFLISSGYTDEEGNIIPEDEDTDESEEEESIEEILEEPDCFKLSLADDRDPSCKRCRLLSQCMVNRIANRPGCFGILWDKNNEECKVCLELYPCGVKFQSNITKEHVNG